MYDYIVRELRDLLVQDAMPLNVRHGITGHSMGGHGALTIAFRNPALFRSVSAFAPIVNPTRSDWGRKQFSAYLGDDEAALGRRMTPASCWPRHGWPGDILIDQGVADQFLDQLRPEAHGRTHRQPAPAGHGADAGRIRPQLLLRGQFRRRPRALARRAAEGRVEREAWMTAESVCGDRRD